MQSPKRKKPDSECSMLYDSIYRMSGKGKTTKTETDPVVARVGDWSGGRCKGTEGVLGVLRLSMS